MHHLVRGDIVKDNANRFGGVHSGRHHAQFVLRQADVLGVCADYRQGCHHLAAFRSGRAWTQLIHYSHNIPAGRKRRTVFLRMDPLAHEQVRE